MIEIYFYLIRDSALKWMEREIIKQVVCSQKTNPVLRLCFLVHSKNSCRGETVAVFLLPQAPQSENI